VADLFAADGILLVVECQSSSSDTMGQVIQRVVGGKVAVGSYEEGDVLEAEGFGTGLACSGQVFSGVEEPEEADDAEVDKVGGDGGVWVGDGEGNREVLDDGEICRVGSLGRIVFIGKGFEETNK
jgi:hypothetical protein